MEAGLDFAFLKYIGVTLENQIPVRRFYLPMFEGRQKVVDLGCGTGGFVALLNEAGIDAIGVDADPIACNYLRERQIPVIEQDVLSYLETVEANSLDGIYSAHLVEHLPYQAVLKLIHLSFAALKPGGILVMATPNPQALISHLKYYHMHFGHKAFYHPELLSFFLDFCGFTNIQSGENPITMVHSEQQFLDQAQATLSIQYSRSFAPVKNPLRRLSRMVKTTIFRFVVQPFLDDLETQINKTISFQQAILRETGIIDRSFECYAVGYKPHRTVNDTKQTEARPNY